VKQRKKQKEIKHTKNEYVTSDEDEEFKANEKTKKTGSEKIDTKKLKNREEITEKKTVPEKKKEKNQSKRGGNISLLSFHFFLSSFSSPLLRSNRFNSPLYRE